MKTPLTDKIVEELAEKFPSFGGGRTEGSKVNPLVWALADKPAMFAAGVDIREVVIEVYRLLVEEKVIGK